MNVSGRELRTSDEERCPYCDSESVDRFSSRGTRRLVREKQVTVLSGYYCLQDDCLRPFIVSATG